MAIFQSGGTVQSFAPASMPAPPAVAAPYGYHSSYYAYAQYAAIYRRQPNVRIVIDFLSGCMAQLGFHWFRRVSDTDRQRLTDFPAAQWLQRPSRFSTQYRLMEATMKDFCIYWAAYWLKLRRRDGTLAALVRIPPDCMEVDGFLFPTAFWLLWPDGRRIPYAPEDIVYFSGYDPLNPLCGLSPLETLRDTLAEEAAARAYREHYWRNSARIESVIERPLNAPPWTPDQKKDFREQWQSKYAGVPNVGLTPVLEHGMTLKPIAFSARDSEYIAARKLTREECAAIYGVPQPSVGILDHATFSNIKEQHKQLYQDTLGPWCKFFAQEFELQLLPDADVAGADVENVYCEANIAEKLKGSFEEQAQSIYLMTGRPIMTANEGRARLNLPAMQDDPTADELQRPLNMASGGTTDAEDAADAAQPGDSTEDDTEDAADRADEPPATPGDDELAQLVAEWEAAAHA